MLENKQKAISDSFLLKKNEFVKDINSDVYIYEHIKTSANVMHISNNDINKTFAIGFKTPPTDNTGIMHILEHSVLCGSEKFPTKEPFVELCKGSLNTFLNAMTYSDKTVYPVASTNEKDFFNLMHVYLDAVFYPNIYKNDKILKQEGWHYHLENIEDELDYKGVVYNEMKGYFSSPINRIFREVERTLYPDNNYAYESGGNPNEIPELTYEQFINTHRNLYHPSNSYITLYGDLDIEKAMNFIDTEYLSKFDKKNINTDIEKQIPFEEMKEFILSYPASNEAQLEDNYMALNLSIDNIDNTELALSMNILSSLLIYSEESPLKQAIIDEGLGEDVFCIYESEVLQPYISIVVKGTPLDKKDKLKEVIEITLRNLVQKRINRDLIEGCLNSYEFAYRENDSSSMPKGLNYSLSAIGAWIHGVNPIEKLKFEEHFENIKKSLDNNYFENIIDKYLLNNTHSSFIVLKPEIDLSNKEDNKIKDYLKELKANLTQNELEKMLNDTLELLEYQEREDSLENLEKIPMLSIEDIETEVEDLYVEEYNINDVKLLHYDIFTGGINYISTMFNVSGVKQEDLCYVGLLSDLICRLDTDNRSYVELSNDVMKNLGGLGFYTKEYVSLDNNEEFTPYIEGVVKVLNNKTENAFKLISEIINDTNFEDNKRMKELILEKISDIEMSIISSGDSLAMSRMNSYFNQVSKYNQYVSGLEYYKFLKNIEKDLDSNIDKLKAKLYEVKNAIFNVNNLIVAFIGEKQELEVINDCINDLKASLRTENVNKNKYSFKEEKLNEGLLIPSEVQYVGIGYNFKKLGHKYNGSMEVLKNILRYGYLWNKVRVQGGAYGARFNITELGNLMLCSYRDPNVKQTYDVYEGIPKYIENIDLNERELNKAIIGAISSIQLPLSIQSKGRFAVDCHLVNKTKELRQQQRTEILNTNIEDLRNLSKVLGDVINQKCCIVVGNDKMNESKDLLKHIYSPLE